MLALIIIKLSLTLIYLFINYFSQQNIISVYIANILRVTIALIDLAVLMIILFRYAFEWGYFAYSGGVWDTCALICGICVLWLTFIYNDKVVKPVFISALIGSVLILVLFICMKYYNTTYNGPVLAMFSWAYYGGWVILYTWEQPIAKFTEQVSQNLTWVDSLIGVYRSYDELVLKNACALLFGIINLCYIIKNDDFSLFMGCLIGSGLVLNCLIGLRLIKNAKNVKMPYGFIIHIIYGCYDNIKIILNQLKRNEVPKAGGYTWFVTLLLTISFSSSAYALPVQNVDDNRTGATIELGESSGELSPSEKRAVGEGASISKAKTVSKPIVDHTKQKLNEKVWDAPANAIWGMFAASGAYLGNLFSISSNENTLHERVDTLEKENQELAKKNELLETENKELKNKQSSHWDMYKKMSLWGKQ